MPQSTVSQGVKVWLIKCYECFDQTSHPQAEASGPPSNMACRKVQRSESPEMVGSLPENVVAAAMQPIAEFDVPQVLRANIQRQSEKLMGLAIALLDSGMDESQVRSIVDHACASYRDELTATILALREQNEN